MPPPWQLWIAAAAVTHLPASRLGRHGRTASRTLLARDQLGDACYLAARRTSHFLPFAVT